MLSRAYLSNRYAISVSIISKYFKKIKGFHKTFIYFSENLSRLMFSPDLFTIIITISLTFSKNT